MAIDTTWEAVAHLSAHAADAPNFLAAFGGNNATSLDMLADVGVTERCIAYEHVLGLIIWHIMLMEFAERN